MGREPGRPRLRKTRGTASTSDRVWRVRPSHMAIRPLSEGTAACWLPTPDSWATQRAQGRDGPASFPSDSSQYVPFLQQSDTASSTSFFLGKKSNDVISSPIFVRDLNSNTFASSDQGSCHCLPRILPRRRSQPAGSVVRLFASMVSSGDHLIRQESRPLCQPISAPPRWPPSDHITP